MRVMAARVLALVILVYPQAAGAVDLHALWHERCQGCHGHSATFARDHAPLRDDLEPFLARHRGGFSPAPAPALIRGIADMLRAEAATPERFSRECRICHGPAAPFVREALVERDGRLVGRYDGRDVDAFLAGGHGRLDAQGAAFHSALLRRVLGEVRYDAAD